MTIERFYVLSMRNDNPDDSYWLVRDRKLKIEDQKFSAPGLAQVYCKVWNEWDQSPTLEWSVK